jgi:hypothetical protein
MRGRAFCQHMHVTPRRDLMCDRLPACLRLPSATFRPPTSLAGHRISRQQGLIGPKTGWKPIIHWVSSASSNAREKGAFSTDPRPRHREALLETRHCLSSRLLARDLGPTRAIRAASTTCWWSRRESRAGCRSRNLAWIGGRLSPSRCCLRRRRTDRRHRTRAQTR